MFDNGAVTHLGADLTDQTRQNEVSYETKASSLIARTIEMDDELVGYGDCDLDLKFTNSWSSAAGKLAITSVFDQYSANNNFSYGYEASSSDCVIKGIPVKTDCVI